MHESVEVDGKNRINNKKKDHIQRAESIDERRLKSFQCTLAVLFSGFFVSFFFSRPTTIIVSRTRIARSRRRGVVDQKSTPGLRFPRDDRGPIDISQNIRRRFCIRSYISISLTPS